MEEPLDLIKELVTSVGIKANGHRGIVHTRVCGHRTEIPLTKKGYNEVQGNCKLRAATDRGRGRKTAAGVPHLAPRLPYTY